MWVRRLAILWWVGVLSISAQDIVRWRSAYLHPWWDQPAYGPLTAVEMRLWGSIGFVHTGFVYRDLIYPTGDGRYRLDPEQAIAQMGPVNYLSAYAIATPLQAFVRYQKVHVFSLGLQENDWAHIRYTRDLAEVLWYGNAPYRDQAKDLTFAMNAIRYQQLYLGYAYHGPNWAVGLRLAAVRVPTLIWTEQYGGHIYTSEYLDSLYLRLNYQLWMQDSVPLWGWAASAGAMWQPAPQWFLFVRWRHLWSRVAGQVQTVRIHADKSYRGSEISTLWDPLSGGRVLDLTRVKDSIKNLVVIDTASQPMALPLPMSVSLGAAGQLSPKMMGWVHLELQRWKWNEYLFAMGLSHEIFPWLTFSAYYNYKFHYAFNLGLALVFHPRPQWDVMIATDNITGTLLPTYARSANLQIGFRWRTGTEPTPPRSAFNKRKRSFDAHFGRKKTSSTDCPTGY